MNPSSRLDPAEHAELIRLLPPPADPELSLYRHRLLKDAFLDQIAAPAATGSRRRLALFAAPVAAAAVAVTLVGVTALDRHRTGGTTAVTNPMVAVAAGNAIEAVPLLERVAHVAGQQPWVALGRGDYVYIRSRVAWLVFAGDRGSGPGAGGADAQVLDEVHTREVWLPAAQGSDGLARERGETFGLSGSSPNSRYAGLPTDPAALLRTVYADTQGQGNNPDEAAFDFLGEALRESLLPPQVAAAVYRAAAKIPGVVLVNDSVDAEGRHGVAVARTDEFGERREWIFDLATLAYLGERSYLTRDTPAGKAGMLTATTAVLQRGVVHRMGELPR